MTVTRIAGIDRLDRRRDRRTPIPPIVLTVADRDFETQDWSLGGFSLSGCRIEALPGEVIPVRITVTVGKREWRHFAEAEIVRNDRGVGEIAAQFVRVGPGTLDTLEALITGRLRRLAARRAKQGGR